MRVTTTAGRRMGVVAAYPPIGTQTEWDVWLSDDDRRGVCWSPSHIREVRDATGRVLWRAE